MAAMQDTPIDSIPQVHPTLAGACPACFRAVLAVRSFHQAGGVDRGAVHGWEGLDRRRGDV